jgi:uncharacterized protein (TIGR03437 family)
VAAGQIVTLFGPGIGPDKEAGAQLTAEGNFATTLSGMRVLFDGLPAPLLYAGWNQISTVAPLALEGRDRTVIQIERDGTAGPRQTVAIVKASPGIFVSQEQRGVVLNEDGTVNSPARPARPGSIVVFYAAGCGPTTPQAGDGEIQRLASPLRARVEVSAGRESAAVLYAGAAPGLISGAVQVNARLSAATPAAQDTPLVLRVDGIESPAVLISVGGNTTLQSAER